MQTGSASARLRSRGFTYLGLLFAIALAGIVLAAAGQRWSTALQRERERELIFRGNQIADAIGSYRARSEEGDSHGPATLQDLLSDERGPKAVHHLRRLYEDPFTGRPDWILLTGADKRIQGVRSRSDARAFITAGLTLRAPGAPARVGDRVFYATTMPAARAPAGAARSASGGADLPIEPASASPFGSRPDQAGDETSPLLRSLPP